MLPKLSVTCDVAAAVGARREEGGGMADGWQRAVAAPARQFPISIQGLPNASSPNPELEPLCGMRDARLPLITSPLLDYLFLT